MFSMFFGYKKKLLILTDTLILPSKTGPDDWAVTNTVTSQANFPRGLVVRIRRSHRRGPGSIPGVGISFLLRSFWIHIASRNYTIMAIFQNNKTIQHNG